MVDSKGQTCDDPTTFPKQCNISVFKQGQTYYVFLIYAKADTTQKYRFYVGPGKTDNPAMELDVHFVQADIGPNPVHFADIASATGAKVKWINKARGIVEIEVGAADLHDFAALLASAQQDLCAPKSYCALDPGKKCKQCTAFDANGKCVTFGTDDVCKWAGADPHCPKGGCIGFRFTLPGGFDAVQGSGPKPGELIALNPNTGLKCNDPNFAVDLEQRKNPSAGGCPLNDDLLKLDFTDVTPPTCQDEGSHDKCCCGTHCQ